MVSDQFWIPAGISEIMEYDGVKKVTVPPRLYRDEEILVEGVDVRWYVNTVTDVVVVTKHYLEDDEYEFVASTSFPGGDNHRITIPKKFFKDYKGRGSPKIRPEIVEKIELPEDGWLHFMYHRNITESDKQSCYVYTESQFDNRFGDDDMSGVPRFS